MKILPTNLVKSNNIARNARNILGSFALVGTMAACSASELKRVQENEPVVEYIDSFTKSNLNKIDTSDRFCFKVDTLKLDKNSLESFENLDKCINQQAVIQNPNIITGTRITTQYVPKPGGGFRLMPKPEHTYEDLVEKNSLQARVKNEVYTEKENSNKYYIPVEFWGSANPNLEAQHVERNERYKDFAVYFNK